MRSLLVVLGLSFGCGLVSAEPLSPADREALLERLDALKAAAVEQTDARFRAGVAAYSSAMSSDDSALELYLKCVEKVEFDDLKKKPGDFRDWKRKEEEKLSKPSLKLALRHQLHWLSLTLQAASEKADRAKLAPLAQAAMDAVFRDFETLKDQQTLLRQPVTSTVFAKAYDITGVKVDRWPMSPLDIPAIYEMLIFPPLRNPRGVPALKENWLRYIQQQGVLAEFSGKDNPKGDKEKDKEGRIGMADNAVRSPEFEKFIVEGLPKMQWDMEIDLFKAGDQAGAALRMLAHIEKNVANQNAKGWSEQFRAMLTAPPEKVPAPAPAPAN